MRVVKSGTDGTYIVPLLPPGTYRIGITAKGAERVIHPGVTVVVTETTAMNVRLQVGAMSATVEVKTTPPTVQTSSALGEVPDPRQVTGLALPDRGGNPSLRPPTFPGNGGPGSSASMVEPGTAGSRRVKTPNEYMKKPPPYEPVDNGSTWLRFTDLVFVDPVGTGYSYPAKPEYRPEFRNTQGDIDSMREATATQLARYTGLGEKFIEKCNLRVNVDDFTRHLMENQRFVLGYYDTQTTYKAPADAPYDVLADKSLFGDGIGSTIVPYLHDELRFKTNVFYAGPFTDGWPPPATPPGACWRSNGIADRHRKTGSTWPLIWRRPFGKIQRFVFSGRPDISIREPPSRRNPFSIVRGQMPSSAAAWS